MFTLKLQHHFDASHNLCLDYESPCLRKHGHRWEVAVEIMTDELDENGMVMDFKKIKSIIDELDHQDLNAILDFNPTAENIAKYFFDKIHEIKDGLVVKISIKESPNAEIIFE